MAKDPFSVEDASLDQLGKRNDFLKNQIQGFNKAARGTGGTGANKFDKDASELSSKQIKVEGEIFDRLSGIHQSRSKRSRSLDESMKAPIADSPQQWADHPDQFDWPGIDTP